LGAGREWEKEIREKIKPRLPPSENLQGNKGPTTLGGRKNFLNAIAEDLPFVDRRVPGRKERVKKRAGQKDVMHPGGLDPGAGAEEGDRRN